MSVHFFFSGTHRSNFRTGCFRCFFLSLSCGFFFPLVSPHHQAPTSLGAFLCHPATPRIRSLYTSFFRFGLILLASVHPLRCCSLPAVGEEGGTTFRAPDCAVFSHFSLSVNFLRRLLGSFSLQVFSRRNRGDGCRPAPALCVQALSLTSLPSLMQATGSLQRHLFSFTRPVCGGPVGRGISL